MKSIRGLFATLTGGVLLFAAGAFASTTLAPKSPCSGSGANFSVQIGYDQATQKVTVDKSSNADCVAGGYSISFTTATLSGWSWSVAFPSPTPGSSIFTNSCALGNGSNQSSSCTVISSPTAGDYHYSISLTDPQGGNHSLDPKVIISGFGLPTAHHRRKSPSAKAAASAQQ